MRMMSTVRGLHDKSGKPLMFGITFDGTLTAVGAAFGDAEAVRIECPAPALPFTHAVAGSQNKKGEIWLAASFGTDADSASSLYVCGPLSNDTAGWPAMYVLDGSPGVARFNWTPKRTGGETTHIPEIQIGTDDDDLGPPMILISTTLETGKVPRYERLSAAPGDDLAEPFPKFEDATDVLDVVLASRPKGRGAYALYRVGTRGTTRLEFAGVPHPIYLVPIKPFTLTTPPGAMSLKTEVDEDGHTNLIVRGNGVFRFSSARQNSYGQGEQIAADAVSTARVTSRSVLTDDYGHNEQGVFGARKAFRSTITVPADTCQVQVWATEATPAEVDGRAVTLDPVKAVRVAPSAVSRLTVSLSAKGITCPTLIIRTDEMNYHQRLYIFPDVGLHRTITELPAGSIREARRQLGISEMLGSSADGIQKVLQNLTRSIQYTHNRTDYGFHHDRTVYANNLDAAHFSLKHDAAGRPVYWELGRQEASGAVHGPEQPVTIDDLKSAFGDLQSVTITTLDKLGGDLVDTAGQVADDLRQTFYRMGDDLVHGNFRGMVSDFFQGGENVRMDLLRGAANVFGDVVEGGAKILYAVVKLAGRTLKFVLQNTGDVGKFLLWLLEQLGVKIEKLIAYLAKTIGWEDILKTHDVVADMITHGLDKVAEGVGAIRQRGDALLGQARQNMGAALDGAISKLGGVSERDQPLTSEFMEASEWLAHRVATHSDGAGDFQAPPNLSLFKTEFGRMEQMLEARLGSGGQHVIAALNAAGIDFEKFRQNPDKPEILIAGLLEITKALGTFALEVVGAIWDLLLMLLEGLVKALKELIIEPWNVPFVSDFYSFITKGERAEGKKLSVLSVTSLLIAIPATPIYRLVMKDAPFQPAEFAMRLDPMTGGNVAAGAISAGVQFAMWGTTVPTTILQARSFRKGADKVPSSYKPTISGLSLLDVLLSLTSDLISMPYGHQDPSKDPAWEFHTAVVAPARMGRAFLTYTLVPIGLGCMSVVAGQYFSNQSRDFLHWIRSLSSLGQVGFASAQQKLEYNKKALLNTMTQDFWTKDDPDVLRAGLIKIVDEGLSADDRKKCEERINHEATLDQLKLNRGKLKNYHEWADAGGIAEKGYAMFMSIIPHTLRPLYTQWAIQGSRGVSLAIGAGLNMHCRLAGGITMAARTGKNALL